MLRPLILALIKSESPASLASGLVSQLAERRTMALARLWLRDDQSDDLRLAASAGTPSGGGFYGRTDGDFARQRLGVGKIGRIAATREPMIVRGIRGDEDWIANVNWIARQGVRAFAGYPLVADDDVLGVLAIFDREIPSDEAIEDLRLVADVAAARLAHLRVRAAALVDRPEPLPPDAADPQTRPALVVTRSELRLFEKQNIEAALSQAGGRIFGPRGAAALLGVKPTTLASRIKALGITPPAGTRRRKGAAGHVR